MGGEEYRLRWGVWTRWERGWGEAIIYVGWGGGSRLLGWLGSLGLEGAGRPDDVLPSAAMTREQALQILQTNHGFGDGLPWVDFAIEKGFRPVQVTPVTRCPDCGAEAGQVLGQYVYYSSLLRLKECPHCRLIYTDGRIDPSVTSQHFETSYKDESYFTRSRGLIFDQIVSLLEKSIPQKGRVLDIGGAKGHLLNALKERRPDLELVLNDISEDACRHAKERYGLTTVCGRVADLPDSLGVFDAVLMIDVVYYETEVQKMWERVGKLMRPGGELMLRIPNRVWWLKSFARFYHHPMQSRIPGFNPEHVTVVSGAYLKGRMRALSLKRVELLCAAGLVRSERAGGPLKMLLTIGELVRKLTFGRILPSSSLLVRVR